MLRLADESGFGIRSDSGLKNRIRVWSGSASRPVDNFVMNENEQTISLEMIG